MPGYHLAQLNVARLLQPIDHPATQGFVDGLDPINAAAEASPGFVWRLQSESGSATDIRVDADEFLLVNLSVWESKAALRAFVYRGDHLGYVKRRSEWFELSSQPYMVMWWIAIGHVPTTDEAIGRLTALRDAGPTPFAFTLGKVFDPPS